jgi:hypothetical protein
MFKVIQGGNTGSAAKSSAAVSVIDCEALAVASFLDDMIERVSLNGSFVYQTNAQGERELICLDDGVVQMIWTEEMAARPRLFKGEQ